jgi:hypothetical protein
VVDLLVQGALISVIALAKYGLSELGKWPGATWATALLGGAVTLVILTAGSWVERGAEKLFRRKANRDDDDPPKTSGG